MIKRFFLYIFVFYTHFLNGQVWQFTKDTIGDDYSFSSIETLDNGILISVAHNNRSVDLFKLKAGGSLLWKKSYLFERPTMVWKLKYSEKQEYFMSGFTQTIDTLFWDPFIIKLNKCFEPVWFKIFNEPKNENSLLNFDLVNDSTIICFVQGFNSDYTTILSLNTFSNNINWNKTLENEIDLLEYEKKNDVYRYFCGTHRTIAQSPIVRRLKANFFQFDNKGNFKFEKIQNLNDTNSNSSGVAIVFIDSNNLLGAFYNKNFVNPNINGNVSIIKTDSEFNIRFLKVINDTNYTVYPKKIVRLNSNRFYVIGEFIEDPDLPQSYPIIYLIDSNANILKQTYINKRKPNSGTDISCTINSAFITHDQKLLVTGEFINSNSQNFDVFAQKLNLDLSLDSFHIDNLTYDKDCYLNKKDTTYLVLKPTIIPIDNNDFKLDSIPSFEYKLNFKWIRSFVFDKKLNIFPNPSSSQIWISPSFNFENSRKFYYSIINEQGLTIQKSFGFSEDLFMQEIDISNINQGLYNLVISDENGLILAVAKFVKK